MNAIYAATSGDQELGFTAEAKVAGNRARTGFAPSVFSRSVSAVLHFARSN